MQIFTLVLVFATCLGLRRLRGGKETEVYKPYMVYMVQSEQSPKNFDNWLCGGALISVWQVLTAATCLADVSHLYVIAGYRKYINGRAIEYDECTKNKKNRVMKTCRPRNHKLSFTNRSMWMEFDIGVAFVEKRYDPKDLTWLDLCSYIPKPIRVSYEKDLTSVDRDVVAFGWGAANLRIQTDILDNNAMYLREISTLIQEKKICKDKFRGFNVRTVIDYYMICTSGHGNLDGGGWMESIGSIANSGCGRRSENGGGGNCSRNDEIRTRTESKFNSTLRQPVPSRRQSLCQNDHGGPLVTWLGSEEVLIGVACTGIVDSSSLICTGPSIFTSTHCMGKVVQCLTALTKANRRRCAEEIKGAGVMIEDIDINWEKKN